MRTFIILSVTICACLSSCRNGNEKSAAAELNVMTIFVRTEPCPDGLGGEFFATPFTHSFYDHFSQKLSILRPHFVAYCRTVSHASTISRTSVTVKVQGMMIDIPKMTEHL